MRKRIFQVAILLAILLLFLTSYCLAAGGYDFEMNYTGELIANQEKSADVVLVGDGTSGGYSKVRIKVEVTGPSTPRLLATDSGGNEIDIAQTGYWGPDDGFALPATVRNVTPVRATYDRPGEYRIKLSLINKEAADAVITSKEFVLTVAETSTANNEVGTNNTISNETIEELPKTGASIPELIAYLTAIVGLIAFAMYRMGRNQVN